MSTRSPSRAAFIVLPWLIIAAAVVVGAVPTLRERMLGALGGSREAGQDGADNTI